MLKSLKIIGISMLAVVILAGSAGISLFIHACGSGKKLDYRLYPEYFSVGKSCCDPWAGKTMSSCSKEEHGQHQGISKEDCCESMHVILRIPQLIHPQPIFVDFSLPGHIAGLFLKTTVPEPVTAQVMAGYWAGDPSPPPLSGRALLIALHQIQIPS